MYKYYRNLNLGHAPGANGLACEDNDEIMYNPEAGTRFGPQWFADDGAAHNFIVGMTGRVTRAIGRVLEMNTLPGLRFYGMVMEVFELIRRPAQLPAPPPVGFKFAVGARVAYDFKALGVDNYIYNQGGPDPRVVVLRDAAAFIRLSPFPSNYEVATIPVRGAVLGSKVEGGNDKSSVLFDGTKTAAWVSSLYLQLEHTPALVARVEAAIAKHAVYQPRPRELRPCACDVRELLYGAGCRCGALLSRYVPPGLC